MIFSNYNEPTKVEIIQYSDKYEYNKIFICRLLRDLMEHSKYEEFLETVKRKVR